MIDNLLTDALKKKIAEAVKDFRLSVKNGEMRCPQIFDGDLPPKRSGNLDDFPFVVVRPESGKSNREQTETEVAIIIGCYSMEVDGYKYCMNVLTRIKTVLLSLPEETLDKRYKLLFPIEWNNIPDQPYPQWQLNMTTKWTYRTPQAVSEEVL